MTISVIITNFNGLKIIKKSLVQIITNTPQASEFIFIDDASTDDSVNFVKKVQHQFPQLKLIVQPQNRGFPNTSNTAVQAATGDLVVLLNNDIFPTPNYLAASLSHFSDPQVFGVGFAESGHPNWARVFWGGGYLQHQPGPTHDATHISAWLSGGSSIVRKELFLKLGGFDEIYSPFYFEDLDLGYRAWKSGYKLLWEPQSIVVHNHGTTTSKLPRRFVSYVKERNHLLTVLRLIDNPKLLTQNKFAQLGRVFFGPNYIKIIHSAYLQLKKYPAPIVIKKLTDEQIFHLFQVDE